MIFGIDRRLLPIPKPQLLHTLKEAAVDQNAPIAGLEKELRTGNGLRGSEKGHLHMRLGYVTLVPSALRKFVSLCSSIFDALKMCPTP